MENKSIYIQAEGPLFEAVQQKKLFTDCKTFVDCIPKEDPETILNAYQKQKSQPDFDLKKFISKYFFLPSNAAENFISDKTKSMEEHIESLWQILSQEPDQIKSPFETLLPLPYPYIVPGGRFREIYYWDSYFTSEGLAASGHIDVVVNMAKNFAFLIEQIGHIPNGNRVYYQSRSQPPYFCCLLSIIEKQLGLDAITPFIHPLEKEYQFWMDGKDIVSAKNPTYRRVVWLEENVLLNRYWDDCSSPRPESYREDLNLMPKTNLQARQNLYRNIRASCESGWDFSSRWFHDQKSIVSLCTTELIPIDLNTLLYFMETKLAQYSTHLGDEEKSEIYAHAASIRKKAIEQYCWQGDFYYDYSWSEKKVTSNKTLAAANTLFFKLCDDKKAKKIAEIIEKDFLMPGGLTTTLVETDQQWDKPNGWAPLQWIATQGLLHYGHNQLAREIATRWVTLNREVYVRTGKLLEKYNVCGANLRAGGGEYPLQDGFGWTNGVAIALIKQFNL